MLFRRDPKVPVTPTTQVSQLLHFRVIMLYVVLDRQASRIIYPDVATKPEEYAGSLECEESRVRPAAVSENGRGESMFRWYLYQAYLWRRLP